MSEIYIQTHLQIDDEAWPPMQPRTFTPLVLIQYKDECNLNQFTAVAELVEQGYIDNIVSGNKVPMCKRFKLDSGVALQQVLDTCKITKEFTEILALLEESKTSQFVLIEGAPGIGKSLLLKEIAYLWGEKKVLKKFKLVLLVCLRDPRVQKMSFIDDLLQSFCNRDRKAEKIATACSDYLTGNNGEDVAFLFDGYDEYPEIFQKDSLVADILKRKVLPKCGLIVSSRPHASVNLRKQATVKVEIIGFAEGERKDYIKEAMKGQPQKIDELTQYLKNHSTISSLCFVPFNMVVLVYIYKLGIPLPKNYAELYDYFICLTVCQHLNKHGHHLSGNIKLTDLPEPCYKIIQQLSKLSLEALNNNRLVFTVDEISAACPGITGVPGAINGFGLLRTVKHFGSTGTTMTFNFLHSSIQEYLATHYIIHNLTPKEELKIIKEKFWKDAFFNMFSMYVSLTKGQRSPFKLFLSGGKNTKTISDEFLNDQLQCFRLYHCFHEAGDDDACKIIQQSRASKNDVDLNSIRLAPSDVECVTVYITSSLHKELVWVELDLYKCFIQDHGLHILHRGLCCNSDITIGKLWLDNNGLTTQSFSLISEITVKCKVKELGISNNNITEDQQLYSMLAHSSSKLEHVYMQNTKLSSKGGISLFKALEKNNKIKKLNITDNCIDDDACDAIITALQKNSCLIALVMYSNPMSGNAILNLVTGIEVNNTLELLMLPKCSEDIRDKVITIQNNINKKRENRGFQKKLKIIINC